MPYELKKYWQKNRIGVILWGIIAVLLILDLTFGYIRYQAIQENKKILKLSPSLRGATYIFTSRLNSGSPDPDNDFYFTEEDFTIEASNDLPYPFIARVPLHHRDTNGFVKSLVTYWGYENNRWEFLRIGDFSDQIRNAGK